MPHRPDMCPQQPATVALLGPSTVVGNQKTTTIAILGGNAVVARALEVLLRSVGYEVRLWLEETEAYDGPEELLEGVDVLLLGPGLGAEERREEYLGDMTGALETAAIAVLAFSPGQEGTIAQVRRLVPWPCRIEDLARKIEAALASARSGNGQEEGTLSVCGCGRRGC